MIALLQQHDERGMDALLLHCGPLMRYIIAPIVPNALDREECLSEASLRVWNKIAQFDAARGSWSAWLTAVTRNTALNFQRSAARHGDAQTLPEDAPSPEASPEEALIQAERRAALHDALARLGQNDRALFYRKYYYLQPTAQIAAEPGNTALLVERGKLHYRMGEWGPALNDFNAALRIDDTHVEAKEFARMVQEILEFRYKDIYNP